MPRVIPEACNPGGVRSRMMGAGEGLTRREAGWPWLGISRPRLAMGGHTRCGIRWLGARRPSSIAMCTPASSRVSAIDTTRRVRTAAVRSGDEDLTVGSKRQKWLPLNREAPDLHSSATGRPRDPA